MRVSRVAISADERRLAVSNRTTARHIVPVHVNAAKSESLKPDNPEWLAEWPIAGGPVVFFRHVRPDDQPLVTEAIRTASRETLLHRFFSPIRSVSPEQLRRMLAIDRTNELCIVGVVPARDATRIVCGARYVRLHTPGAAEIALTVHDDFQHRGLGSFLLQLLTRLAAADGIRRFEADVMTSNQKMLNLFSKLVPDRTSTHRLGDVNHLVFELSKVVTPESRLNSPAP